METAKVFWSGRSQAVRLPKDYRFDVEEVRIRRSGNAIILEPITEDWEWPAKVIEPLNGDFDQAVGIFPPSELESPDAPSVYRGEILSLGDMQAAVEDEAKKHK